MANKQQSDTPADKPPPHPYARQRKTALIVFWGGLAVAAVNPPGQLMALGTIAALVGAFWLVGMWLNTLWAKYVVKRL